MLQNIQNSLKHSEKNIVDIKNITQNVNSNAEKAQNATTSYADILRSQLNSDTNKHPMYFRSRIASTSNDNNIKDTTPKRKHINRKLTSGTDSTNEHDLGSEVLVDRSRNKQIKYTKSVYVSKLQPTVTNEKLMNYILKKTTRIK